MRVIRAVLAVCLAALLVNCQDGVAPPRLTSPITLSIVLGTSSITSVLVDVTASDLPAPLHFNLTVTAGVASGIIDIPAGSGRTVTVHAYDAAGTETHRGSATISVISGTNPLTSIILLPLTGEVPITATLGAYVVVITPATETVSVGGVVHLSATVTDGVHPVAVTPHWASLAPSLASVDSTGTVRGLVQGLVTIVATYGSSAGSALLLVSPSGLVPPSVTIAPPSGVQRAVMVVDFVLAHSLSEYASVLAEYSTDGGSTWHGASRAPGLGDSLTALATSPAGVKHTFYWAARTDSVALTGAVATMRLRLTPSAGTPGLPAVTPAFTMNNNLQQVIATATASFPRDGATERKGEVAIGDLVADAMRLRAGTQLAMMNGGGIRSPLPSSFVVTDPTLRRAVPGPYDLVMGDALSVLPFSNRMVTRTVTGAQLWAVLEMSVKNWPVSYGGFMQISGFSFTWSQSAAPGARVLSVTLSGGAPILANGTTYTLALTDFNNAGGDGYAMLNDGTGTPGPVLFDVLLDRLIALGSVTPTIAGRITPVP